MIGPAIDPAMIVEANPAWRGRSARVSRWVPAIASPMQRGVDHDGWRVEIGEERWFLKIPSPDQRRFIDAGAALDAARVAGQAGVAPPLLWSDAASGAGAWPLLEAGWRTATLGDLSSPAVLRGVIAAKRRVHDGPRFGRTRNVFDLVTRYADEARAAGVALPDDHAWMLANVAEMARAIAASGIDLVACHGDGIASNVMLGSAGQVLLVDWDEAGTADPYWDLGSLFAEACAFDAPARAALQAYAGRSDEGLFARCRLYGIADDVAWGIRSLIAAATTDRPDIEFFKYAQWRLLRARMNLRDRGFEAMLRTV